MGRKQQQRRAKKKEAEDLVTSSSSASATLKCTACRQVVSVDNSIACPVPECDRIFCIMRCSSKCIVHCAAPDCPDPNRCRLCASGQTHKLLQRYTSQEVSDIHEAFTPCDMPDCDATFCAMCEDSLHWCHECIRNLCGACSKTEMSCCDTCGYEYCQECIDELVDDGKICHSCAETSSQDTAQEAGDRVISKVDRQADSYCFFLHFALARISAMSWRGGILRDELEKSSCEKVGTLLLIQSKQIGKESSKLLSEIESALPEHIPTLHSQYHSVMERFRAYKDVYFRLKKRTDLHTKLLQVNLNSLIRVHFIPVITSLIRAHDFVECNLVSDCFRCEIRGMFLDSMQNLFEKRQCGYCLKSLQSNAKRRGGCKAIYHCNQACQALSWSVHGHCDKCACMKEARLAYNNRTRSM